MKPIVVAAAIILKGHTFLIDQRLATANREASKWEFPGGKVEFLEDPEACARREIKEELNIDIEILEPYCIASPVFKKNGETKHFVIIFFLSRYVSGTVKNLECQDSTWVTKEKLKHYQFSVGTKPAIKKLLSDTTIK